MPKTPKPAATRQRAEPTPAHIRWLIRRDMPEVLDIDSDKPSPWTEEDFLNALRHRKTIGMVAEVPPNADGKVVGFMIYRLFDSRLDVLNFSVHRDHRGRSIGRQLVGALVRKLSSHRRTRIRFPVRESDLDGQLFLRHMGFRAVRVDRDPDGDAYVMEYRIGTEADADDWDGPGDPELGVHRFRGML